MFGQLPNLFERNFIIGYFLPVVAFLIATLVLATTFRYFPPPDLTRLLPLDQTEVLICTTLFVLMSVFGAVVLLSLNREVMGLMEGTGRFNPARVFLRRQMRRYSTLVDSVDAITDDITTASATMVAPEELEESVGVSAETGESYKAAFAADRNAP